MSRITNLSELYKESVQELTKSREDWIGLLSSMARYYKYSFDNNVLIYAQRPDAGQLATMEIWNKVGRRVNRGAKSIAVIDLSNPKASLKYLFDLMDTNGNHESFRRVMGYTWDLEEQYKSDLLVIFHEKYETDTSSLESCIYDLILKCANETLSFYEQNFIITDQDSILYGLPKEAVIDQFIELARDSAAHVVFKKCGLSTDLYIGKDFENISHFNNMESFMKLGSVALSIARPVLQEIYMEIQNIKKERSAKNRNESIDKTYILKGQRRNTVPQSPNIGERTAQAKGNGKIREAVEGIHDGEVSRQGIGTDSRGSMEHGNNGGGRGRREQQGNADTGTLSSTAASENRGHTGTASPHADVSHDSGRNRNERNGTEKKINQTTLKTNFPGSGESLSGKFSSSENQPLTDTVYSEGELSDLVDLFLIADDAAPYIKDWQREIHSFFTEDAHKLSAKANVVKSFYGSYDDHYHTITDEEMVIRGASEGIDFDIDGQHIFLTYTQLAEKIDNLIMYTMYPFSDEFVIDDFIIPDEAHEMQGINEEVSETVAETLTVTKEQIIEKEKPTDSKRLQLEAYAANEQKEEQALDVQSSDQQFNLFTDYNFMQDAYEMIGGTDSDDIITETIVAENHPTFEADVHVSHNEVTGEETEAIEAEQIVSGSNEDNGRGLMSGSHSQTMDSGINYHYSHQHNLYEGGPKTKCKNNIEAIRLLKNLHSKNRLATAEEQITLARFVGWGGLANALTPGKSGWEKEYEEIKSLLTEEEFKSAQESTTTAYYTEQSVIRHIYKALERFGFREGNIIDPAMGTGNFYSVLPESMSDSKLYGVELDTITGGIAKQLYPAADIEVKGFEDTNYPDHFFDIAIGNIPFNAIKVSDMRYDKHNFRIHDYFIAKTLDKVRSGGIIAFITSKYTLDKANPTIRKYIAQRAELIGAIRLPNNAFKTVAGTEVTTDIIFLQKRDNEVVPDERDNPWISVEKNGDDIPINSYFIDHPEMILGRMAFDESMYGNEKTTACLPREGDNLDKLLGNAVYYLDGQYREPSTEFEDDKETDVRESIKANPSVKNYCYTLVDDNLYYRENSQMYKQNITGKKRERIEGLIEIRSALRSLIEFQTNPFCDGGDLPTMDYETNLQELIDNLNNKYDNFVKQHGYINSFANVRAFSKDSDAPLIRSIEQKSKNEKGVFEKTAVFYKATIKPKVMPKSVDNAVEALKMSLNIKGRVDLDYMQWLYRRPDFTKPSVDEIIEELGDRIYQDPARFTGDPHAGWVTAGEYLSGKVKEKLGEAVLKAEKFPELFTRNAEALREVQPTPLKPQEINFTLGSTWIPKEVYQQFMYETFQTSGYCKSGSFAIEIEYSPYSAAYHISGKGREKDSVFVNKTYGTERKNAYEILEDALNQKSVTVKDPVPYVDHVTGEDKVKYILNKAETVLAREKQAQIKMGFDNWLFSNPERAAALTQLYNDRFNNIRPRQYDGSDLMLPDINDEIKLRKHQLELIARGVYSGRNVLGAHEVGAGKTMSGVVMVHELKRMGIFHKPLITAPNHLVGQWANEYLRLYPSANILVTRKKDLEKKNRRRFVSRIATGDYDVIIMAHSSFELINLSREKQLSVLKKEINEITNDITKEKRLSGKEWSLKQMQIFQRNLQYRYDRLFNAEKKDDTVNFEELGVDMLVIDESDFYKNNFSYTKLRNVAGISGQSSQRAMDMHMKCRHISEMNGGKGVVQLSGTPVSNSISELYVIQKTLQPEELQDRGLMMFDAWASTFGKIETSLEIRPEGNGYQMKSRFAKFHNLPELMSMLSMVTDIKTAEMLPDLPVPKLITGGIQVIKTAITPDQRNMVDEIVMRAEDIREKRVTSDEDNFLKLTNEARLLAIDPRILDPSLPDDPNTKLNECAHNTAKIYHETTDKKLTQLIFCDTGTPKDDGSFDFYNATKRALIAQGVKLEEIAFIHDAKTDWQKEALFDKIRRGEIRILMGSTGKMGTGMNVQDKLIAIHHLDIPWRPRDLIQRNGRGLRQGNQNEKIHIFQYITEQTFDAYLFQILEKKQRYISQIMTGRSALRSCEDVDETVLQYAEIKALAVGDERIKEKMEVDNEISRLQILKSSWKSQQGDLQYQIGNYYPEEIKKTESMIEKYAADIATFEQNKPAVFSMYIDGHIHDERAKAGEHLKVIARRLGHRVGDELIAGSYAGFVVSLSRDWYEIISIKLKGKNCYSTDMGNSELGNITRLENLAERIRGDKANNERKLESLFAQLEQAKTEVARPFSDEERLSELLMKKVELDLALEFKDDYQNDAIIDGDGVVSQESDNESEEENEIER